MFNRNSKKNTRFAIYAGNPGFSGMVICSDFIGYVKAPSLSDAYDAAYRYLANSGYTAIVVREASTTPPKPVRRLWTGLAGQPASPVG